MNTLQTWHRTRDRLLSQAAWHHACDKIYRSGLHRTRSGGRGLKNKSFFDSIYISQSIIKTSFCTSFTFSILSDMIYRRTMGKWLKRQTAPLFIFFYCFLESSFVTMRKGGDETQQRFTTSMVIIFAPWLSERRRYTKNVGKPKQTCGFQQHILKNIPIGFLRVIWSPLTKANKCSKEREITSAQSSFRTSYTPINWSALLPNWTKVLAHQSTSNHFWKWHLNIIHFQCYVIMLVPNLV